MMLLNGINVNGFKGDKSAIATAGSNILSTELVLPSPFDTKREIVYKTYADDPGMIYYWDRQVQQPKEIEQPSETTEPSSILDSILDILNPSVGYYPEGVPTPKGPPIGGSGGGSSGFLFPRFPIITIIRLLK
ncbi:hypothetical protein K0T92_07360 [Paenibacillus oenotherae]|uniref:Uncharacterized protein n=1 Tax=Paenibacillus oenotherae TaxID=1435645 RepID=A0ABS7D3Q0_9BACL|nr:hypothetical protein [Paenibacillus oenotherae]MBW7474559.1 hypothetical protein [Paenibacillus oenotherae]